MKQYHVRHRTSYRYSSDVTIGYNEFYLTPRETVRQKTLRRRLRVTPEPTLLRERTDYFGNGVTYIELQRRHRDFEVVLEADVEVAEAPVPPETPPWETVAAEVRHTAVETVAYTLESPYVQTTAAVVDFARPSFPAGRPVLEAAMEVKHRIYRDFRFKSGVTTIGTTQDEVLDLRCGVCQDFAHLQIAALRSMGLPARYVSGYLLTVPPPGKPRLVGADASHAWLAVWCGAEVGWVDLDPTNDVIPGEKHVTLAWGMDYRDVSPVRGIVLGGGEQRLDVGVDVVPFEEGELAPL